jgi:hypothetical protein
MSVKTTRMICWGLTLLLYAVGLFLPYTMGRGDDSVAMATATFCLCSPINFGASAGSSPLEWAIVFGFLATELAHPVFWMSWLAYRLRAPVLAAAYSGLAAGLWLVLPCVSMFAGPTWFTWPYGAGYWSCFLAMVGMCLLALLSRGAMRAEYLAARAEEQAARAAAVARDAAIAAILTERAEGRGDPSNAG